MAIRRQSLVFVMLLLTVPAHADDGDETAVRTLIADWYTEIRKEGRKHPQKFLAPGAMLLPERCPDRCGPLPRVARLQDWPDPHYLARQAPKFEYEIERLRVEHTLARADVWERGFTYAWALKKTTQSAAAATIIMEKRKGEGWKILLYRSLSRAIRPKDKDAPLPDLSPKKR